MTCFVCTPASHLISEVSGTWDFKWAAGTQIRVAFQRPSRPQREWTTADQNNLDRLFDDSRLRIIELARRWLDELRGYLDAPSARKGLPSAQEFFRDGINLTFPDELVFESRQGEQGTLGQELRSPFLPETADHHDYDVLVSLEPLPLNKVDPFRVDGPVFGDAQSLRRIGVDRIILPNSELGSYARRVDFGMPTVFLGPFTRTDGKVDPLDAYLRYPLAEHVVVHEFGHVLGLAHEHQNPYYPNNQYRAIPAIRDGLSQAFGIPESDISDAAIKSFLIDRWPGSLDFSDWYDGNGPGNERSLADVDSVMTYPFHGRFLRDSPLPLDANLLGLISSSYEEGNEACRRALNEVRTKPTKSDIEQLVRMYS